MKFLRTILWVLLSSGFALAQPRPTEGLGGLIIHVSFANDRGDGIDYLEFGGKHYDYDQASRAVLPQIGWKQPGKRAELAQAWVQQVCLLGRPMLETKPAEFGEQPFEKPSVKAESDGSVDVSLWKRDAVGKTRGKHFSNMRYHFGPDGSLDIKVLKELVL